METPQHPKIGRPSMYTEKLADEICLMIATSTKGLKRLVAEHPGWPNECTIYEWIIKREPFAKQYARAKEQQAQAIFDEMMEISDNTQEGVEVTEIEGEEGNTTRRTIKDMTQHRRLQIDTRKWCLSRLLPKKYGDKLEVSNTSDPLGDLLKEFRSQSAKIEAASESESEE